MRLTPTEYEIIEHRLVLDDCLADCLEEEFDRALVERVADDLLTGFKVYVKHGATIEWDEKKASPVAIAIMKDCLEGSTFFADADDAAAGGEIKRGALLSWHKAANSLERKFLNAGIIANIPRS